LGFSDDDLIIKVKLLFLVTHKCVFDQFKEKSNREVLEIYTKEKLLYILSVLETISISEIRFVLEDKLFSLINPEEYLKYADLRKMTVRIYNRTKDSVIEDLKFLFGKENVNGSVEVRLKSIYSIYKKILRKNIYYSLVLDIIGYRIILDKEVDCYKVMLAILRKWSILNNKIKDYIAIPKSNGYSSIHLTIMHDEHPVEIQIRTKDMDKHAQYGKAAHFIYKKT